MKIDCVLGDEEPLPDLLTWGSIVTRPVREGFALSSSGACPRYTCLTALKALASVGRAGQQVMGKAVIGSREPPAHRTFSASVPKI